MKNLSNNKLSREQLKKISGNGFPIFNCTYECCPEDGRPLCPGYHCPAVVCPK